MNFLFAINDEFRLPLMVTMKSIFLSNGKGHRFFLFYTDLSAKTLSTLSRFATKDCQSSLFPIRIQKEDLCIFDCIKYRPSRLPRITFARLLAPYYLPITVDKILYIDTDTLVIRPLETLYSTPVEGIAFVGCPDNDRSKHFQRFPSISKYVNAGVLLINLKFLRANFKIQSLQQFTEINAELLEQLDQDIVNLCFQDQLNYAPGVFNFQVYSNDGFDDARRKFADEEAAIYHFVGGEKPWSKEYHNYLGKKYLSTMASFARRQSIRIRVRQTISNFKLLFIRR